MSFTTKIALRRRRSRLRTQKIKLLNEKPVIRKVDVEAIKAEFAANKA